MIHDFGISLATDFVELQLYQSAARNPKSAVACGAASALPPDPAILFAGTKTMNVEPLAYRSHPEDDVMTRCQ